MFSDQHVVPVFQSATVDPSIIDVCPIQGIIVFDNELIVIPIDFCVMTGDGEIIDLDHIVRKTADGRNSLGEWNLFQHRLLEL